MPTYPNNIDSKLPMVGTTIFTVMSKLAADEKAINLSQGFPDFESDPVLLDLVSKSMKDGYNQYAPMQGVPALREAISTKLEKLYSAKYNPETEITITAGATQAIYTAISAVIKEGDEVIIFTPAYDCYAPAIEINGGKCVYIQLDPKDYSIDWSQVRKMLNRKTKMIIINTPHNPTGSILSSQDMSKLEQITKESNMIVLSDEVYEHIIFDTMEHQSIARFPTLAERSFAIFSFGKTFHNTGWKLGFCVGPENLMKEFNKVHQFNVFSCNTPMQYAIAEYMSNEDNYNYIPEFYQKKRDLFNKSLAGSNFKIKPSSGTYFQLLDYSNISDERDKDFAIRLTKENKIASIPLSPFYSSDPGSKVLRFCFAKQDETIERATEILARL